MTPISDPHLPQVTEFAPLPASNLNKAMKVSSHHYYNSYYNSGHTTLLPPIDANAQSKKVSQFPFVQTATAFTVLDLFVACLIFQCLDYFSFNVYLCSFGLWVTTELNYC